MKWLLNIFDFLILARLHFSPCEGFICYADTMVTCWSAKFTSSISSYSHRYREPLLTSLYIYIQVGHTCKIWKGQWILSLELSWHYQKKVDFDFCYLVPRNILIFFSDLLNSAPLHSWDVSNPYKIFFYFEDSNIELTMGVYGSVD